MEKLKLATSRLTHRFVTFVVLELKIKSLKLLTSQREQEQFLEQSVDKLSVRLLKKELLLKRDAQWVEDSRKKDFTKIEMALPYKREMLFASRTLTRMPSGAVVL
jgi:hypothetical protein